MTKKMCKTTSPYGPGEPLRYANRLSWQLLAAIPFVEEEVSPLPSAIRAESHSGRIFFGIRQFHFRSQKSVPKTIFREVPLEQTKKYYTKLA